MIVYKRKVSTSIGRWLIAIAVFVAAMTITWDDVEGTPLAAQTPDQINLTAKN